jgi:hypothetical protein
MGAPAIFEKQIEIKLLHPASTLESRIQVKKNGIMPGSNRYKAELSEARGYEWAIARGQAGCPV